VAGSRYGVPPAAKGRSRALDAALALGIAIVGGLGSTSNQPRSVAAIPLLAVMGLVLFWRRRFPGQVLAVAAACVAVLYAIRSSLEPAFPAVLVSAYSAGVYGTRRLARIVVITAVAVFAAIFIPYALGGLAWLHRRLPVPTAEAAVGAWLVGLAVRRQLEMRNEHAAALAERAALMEERAGRATLSERLRIALELHDIVAHNISVAVIQSQAAQRVADSDPARAKTAMADVERTSRTALEEMRRLLGVLHSGEPSDTATPVPDAAYTPALGLADIDVLAERLRRAGLDVSVVRRGEAAGVPDGVGLTVYRIVQESLTNVLKHAGPAAVTVELDVGDQFRVTVTDDGRGASAALSGVPGAGRGIAGMRERLAAAGGKLSAGPKPGGGYQVRASVPLGGS
jgi:signal transduction histidine kinase